MYRERVFAAFLLLSLLIPTQVRAQQAPTNPSIDAVHGHRRTVPDYAQMRAFDGISWAAPSSGSPAGTVLLAYPHKLGPRLIEWDLARAAILRSIPLGVASPRDVRMAVQGSDLVVVTEEQQAPASLVAGGGLPPGQVAHETFTPAVAGPRCTA